MDFVQGNDVWLYIASMVLPLFSLIRLSGIETPWAGWLKWLLSSCAVWGFFALVSNYADSAQIEIVATALTSLGLATLPIFEFFFAWTYTRKAHTISSRVWVSALAVPGLFIVLILTNPLHHLVWTRIAPAAEPPHYLVFYYGPVAWATFFYLGAVMLVASYVLLDYAFRVRGIYRVQAFAIAIASLFPWVVILAYMLWGDALSWVDPVWALSVVTGVFAIAVGRRGLLELVPVARAQIIDELSDGIIVLDGVLYIADINRAAARMLGTDVNSARGRLAQHVMLGWSPLFSSLETDCDEIHVFTGTTSEGLAVELSVRHLQDTRGSNIGHVLLIRDVSDQSLANQTLLEAVVRIEDWVKDMEVMQRGLRPHGAGEIKP